MRKTEEQHRQDILDVGKLMYQKGWVAANDGNLSVRIDDRQILCTCTGVSKGMMTPADLIVCDLEGTKISGARECTTELGMHLVIYKMRPDVSAIVHAHPPVATGFAVAGRPLNLALLPEVIISLGCVPLAEYGLPGTPALSDGLRPYIPSYDAILLANHGSVCYGEDLYKAFFKMETVEHFALITLVAELAGGPKILPRHEVRKLFESRSRYGVASRNSLESGRPLVAEDVAEDVAEYVAEDLAEHVAAPPGSSSRLNPAGNALINLVAEALRSRGVLT
jgi:L-fuculose-phosphate aldolase